MLAMLDYVARLTVAISPIVTWLPNQIFAVLELMRTVWNGVDENDQHKQPQYVVEMMENVDIQQEKLRKEVERWCQERGV